MAAIRIIRFTVEGTGTFPFDMLRYDAAWPASSEDAIALDHENWRSHPKAGDRYSVKLLSHGPAITPDRWRSFGWTVTAQEVRKF